jgi:hypothetical protein
MQMIQPADRPHFIDYDQRRDDPSLTFLSWGHGTGRCPRDPPVVLITIPAATDAQLAHCDATRWFGDDIRWNPRPESLNHPGYSFDEMINGEKPEGPLFPLILRDQAAAAHPTGRVKAEPAMILVPMTMRDLRSRCR